jgi:hypothetical protein
MSKDSETPPPGGQFLVYRTEDGKLKIDVRFEGETVWLTQQHMAELFQTTKQNIGQHLKSIFAEEELALDSVVKDSFTTAADGKNYATRFYNLDAIISVGYRVKSAVATRFRIWATRLLREYIVKGFNLVEQYLIFAQGQAMRRVPMHMADWIEKLNGFLTLNDRDILTHAGRIPHEMAQTKAELEYDKFKALTASAPRAVDADFEQATKDLKKLPKPKKPKPPKK